MARDYRMKLRTFASIVKVSEGAVRGAIESGRLERCLGRDRFDRPIIEDLDEAMREWWDKDPSKETTKEEPTTS
jgi:hypothetical protein